MHRPASSHRGHSRCQGSAKDSAHRRRTEVFAAPRKGTVDWWDTSLPSFGCRVSQGGAKTFILKLHNSRRAIGRWPLVSLSAARSEANRQLAEKTLGKVRPQSITYAQATKLFIEEKRDRRRTRTVYGLERHLARLDFKCQVADITHEGIELRIKRLSQGEYNHRLAALKGFFNWCVKRRYRTDNPTIGFAPYSRPTRSRVLSDGELQCIWRACERRIAFDDQACGGFQTAIPDAVKLPRPFAAIVQLLILTGMRRGECAALRADYISNDVCTLPSTLTKNGREHSLPLGSLSISIVSAAIASQPSQSALLFPARGAQSAFNGWSKSKVALDKLSGVSDWTLHDARRSYATNMARIGVPIHIIERLLSHTSGSFGGIVSVYQRHEYLDEMREAVNKYEAWFVEHALQSKM